MLLSNCLKKLLGTSSRLSWNTLNYIFLWLLFSKDNFSYKITNSITHTSNHLSKNDPFKQALDEKTVSNLLQGKIKTKINKIQYIKLMFNTEISRLWELFIWPKLPVKSWKLNFQNENNSTRNSTNSGRKKLGYIHMYVEVQIQFLFRIS